MVYHSAARETSCNCQPLFPALENIAPLSGAESWDNVGLLTGDPKQDISRILLTIDYSAAVADEGRQRNAIW